MGDLNVIGSPGTRGACGSWPLALSRLVHSAGGRYELPSLLRLCLAIPRCGSPRSPLFQTSCNKRAEVLISGTLEETLDINIFPIVTKYLLKTEIVLEDHMDQQCCYIIW